MTEKNLLDSDQYPSSWKGLIGQRRAKRVLEVAAKSAKARKEPLPHLLIGHPKPGIGKTALGVLAGRTMGTFVQPVSGVLTADNGRMLLTTLKDRDVVLWDEAHTMVDKGKRHADWLLTYTQDGLIPGPMGMEEYPRVSFIFCTTHATRLPEALLSRLMKVPVEEYTTEEAAKIAIRTSTDLLFKHNLPSIGKSDALALATAGHNNPRAMRNLLIQLRDLVLAGELRPLGNNRYPIDELLEFAGVTPDGLDATAQQYLNCLAFEFAGSAGSKRIEDRLQVPGGLAMTERLLMDKKLIAQTTTGRKLTKEGIVRARELAEGVAA